MQPLLIKSTLDALHSVTRLRDFGQIKSSMLTPEALVRQDLWFRCNILTY
ncbi:uncharacterized protein PHALS_08966 [Plasmopara halstedii]|uniref:Uncharacterized protein n=1 Tax=Plasmopara halstedii TaxID=4781 RepID=A0A0P1AEH8_PLAHL|nr:uncharacterized protein PHALS_08966 [Plasmopara halstedii]CEG38921.1 hypothetical protein PHALS_08966 [Plasmopara halstedii]|eukprot:XP_024575290.1 hypothetical protein PHALS_08966 [Plasmopara halstedii]